ncbi:MAG: helix-turn-helix domain-containing protein [Eubacteriales bacterium]
MSFSLPSEFAQTHPVLYTAWHFRSLCRMTRASVDYNKINYTPRLIVVRSERCLFLFPGHGDWRVEAGDVIYIPPSTVYHTEFFGNALETYNLNFDFMPGRTEGSTFTEKFVRQIPHVGEEDEALCEDAPAFTGAPEFSAPFYLHAPEAVESSAAVVREVSQTAQFSPLRASSMLTEMLVDLVRQVRSARSARIPDVYARIAEYVEAHIGERLSGRQLSEALNYHPVYMGRVMTEITGESLHSYILAVKLRHAKQMLRETELPLAVISKKLAFCDASHFSRVFTAREGITPARYRESAQRM